MQRSGGKPLIENPHFAARIAQAEIDLMARATTNLRMLSKAAAGQAPGAESSMLKIKGTVIRQEINDLMRRAMGPYALPYRPDTGDNAAPHYFINRKLSIFGGSNETQRAIISNAILGL